MITGRRPSSWKMPALTGVARGGRAAEAGSAVSRDPFNRLRRVVFIGMGTSVISVTLGEPSEENGHNLHEPWGTMWPVAVFMLLIVLLGVYRPPVMEDLLDQALRSLSGR